MSFNMSRFLVRVRQFFTRDRLVRVLGVTAIFLFVLNFSNFLSHQFRGVPLASTQFIGDHVHHSDYLSFFDHHKRHTARFYFDNSRYSERTRCWKKNNNQEKYDAVYEIRQRLKEEQLRAKEEALRKALEHHIESKRHIVIKKHDGNSTDLEVKIMIDGEVIDVSKTEVDI